MPWKSCSFKGVWIFEPTVHADDRGYFFETFSEKTLEQTDIAVKFVQDNEAKSSKGVLRGMHYQRGDAGQSKLVRVIKGAVQDVIIDCRPEEPTYGEFFSIVLTETNKTQLFVPRGFAHGYLVLEDETIFSYKCDNFYNKGAEGGVRYNSLPIPWMDRSPLLSQKDVELPGFGQHLNVWKL